MGDYNGRPNFLLKSATGLLWKNLPPDLEALVSMPNMASAIRNFALGPRGLYWYTYQSVNDVIEQRGSSNVWSVLAEDWKGGCPLRVTFGPDGYVWGEKEWMDPNTGGHLVQAFGKQPPKLTSESSKRHPSLKSFEINFVALGKASSWVVGTQLSGPFWSGIPKKLEETMNREIGAGQLIVNLVLCPMREDIYWIEYWDGTIDFSLPTDWDLNAIGGHIMQHVNVKVFRSPFEVLASPSSSTSLSPLNPQDSLYDFGQAGHAPNRNFLRFGKAIYTSSASSKSDDYQVSERSQYRSLIFARMVKGKSKQMAKGDKTLQTNPAGYDSVDGIVGKELNYDETCLYVKDAIRPAFLVLYR
ncbi:hypothetical protein FRB97_005896 [Tulasnella sp. 331]|nr:hypothetical protein FRB97_005896 [Tulasnella sp. 331]